MSTKKPRVRPVDAIAATIAVVLALAFVGLIAGCVVAFWMWIL